MRCDAEVEKYRARDAGLKRYTSKRPCRKGHVGERWTANRMCCACTMAAYREAFPPGFGRYDPAYYQKNKAKENARSKRWREKNPERDRARVQAWKEANPERWQAIQARSRR